jgi:hypothetical protein
LNSVRFPRDAFGRSGERARRTKTGAEEGHDGVDRERKRNLRWGSYVVQHARAVGKDRAAKEAHEESADEDLNECISVSFNHSSDLRSIR